MCVCVFGGVSVSLWIFPILEELEDPDEVGLSLHGDVESLGGPAYLQR